MEENKTKKGSIFEQFKQFERSIFMSITRKQSNKEYDEMIERIEKETGEKPNIEVRKAIRHEIAEKNAKKAKGIAVIGAAIALTVGSISFGGGYALNEGSGKIEGVTKNEKGVNVDTSKIDGEVVVNLSNQKTADFINRVRITEDSEIVSEYGAIENQMIDLYEVRNNVIQEVEVLETQEEKLDYVKERYVEEYNKTHEEKISVENVTFYRSEKNMVYIDTATNGEKINRVCSEKYAEEHDLKQVTGASGIIIYIRVNGKVQEIAVGFQESDFERGYTEKEEVQEQAKDSVSERIGNLLDAGIEYAFAGANNKADRKMQLINEMVKYREGKIKEIINGQLLNQKDSQNGRNTNDFEIGE